MPLDTKIPTYSNGFMRFCVDTVPLPHDCIGLMIGQMRTGNATAGKPVRIYTPQDAANYFGANSMLAKMCQLYFCACGGALGTSALYALPIADNSSGVAPVYTLTVTGPATETRMLEIELPTGFQSGLNQASQNANAIYQIAVNSGDSATVIAAAIAAAITADASSFFTAVASSGVITVTAGHKGTCLNNIVPNFTPNYGDKIPAGVGLAWLSTVTGSGDPIGSVVSTAIANLGACCYDCWALGWQDATAVSLVTQELNNRWACGAADQCFGHFFHYWQDTNANVTTNGASTNDAVRTIIPLPPTYKYPGAFFSAAWAGRVCCQACQQPGRPIVRSNGILGCLTDSGLCGSGPFTSSVRELFAEAGVSVWAFDASGALYIDSNLTNYKYNDYGDIDRTFQTVESRYLVKALTEVLATFNNEFYDSAALVNNGSVFTAGEIVTSPSAYKAHLIGYLAGQTDNFGGILNKMIDTTEDALGDQIVVERDTWNRPPGIGDPNRLNVGFSAALVGQLLRIATRISVSLAN